MGAARLHITQGEICKRKDRPDPCMIYAVATQRRESRDEAPAVVCDLLASDRQSCRKTNPWLSESPIYREMSNVESTRRLLGHISPQPSSVPNQARQ